MSREWVKCRTGATRYRHDCPIPCDREPAQGCFAGEASQVSRRRKAEGAKLLRLVRQDRIAALRRESGKAENFFAGSATRVAPHFLLFEGERRIPRTVG